MQAKEQIITERLWLRQTPERSSFQNCRANFLVKSHCCYSGKYPRCQHTVSGRCHLLTERLVALHHACYTKLSACCLNTAALHSDQPHLLIVTFKSPATNLNFSGFGWLLIMHMYEEERNLLWYTIRGALS